MTTTTPEQLQALAELIRREPDVAALLKLEPLAHVPGRFAFAVETIGEGAPRYVVGSCDAANDMREITAQCYVSNAAEEAFAELMGGSAQA